jgi:hypothetical protein
MIKTLELNRLSVIRSTYSREYPEEALKNLVWLLWSIDKILCLEEKHVEVGVLYQKDYFLTKISDTFD